MQQSDTVMAETRKTNLEGAAVEEAIHLADRVDERRLRKSSSINSMYINTTINKPCVDSIINAVATIMNSQMLEVSSTT